MVRLRSPVWSFVGLSFAVSWVAGVGVLALGQALLPPPLDARADLMIKFGPSLAAVAAVSLWGGGDERRRFWRSVTRVRISPGWYLAAALFPLLFLAGGVAALRPGASITIAATGRHFATAGAMALFLGGGLGEELGWRGYLHPRLSRRHGFLPAALATAVVWSLWHLPMFVLGGDPGIPLGPLVVVVFAASILLGWLYERTDGSLPACIVFHGAVNGGATALAAQVPVDQRSDIIWAYALLLATTSVLLLLTMPWRGGPSPATRLPAGDSG